MSLGIKLISGELTFEDSADVTYLAEAVAEYTRNHTGPLSVWTNNVDIISSQILASLSLAKVSGIPAQLYHYKSCMLNQSLGPISAPLMETVSPMLQKDALTFQKLLPH